MDLREHRDAVLEALRGARERDDNWSWRLNGIGKDKIRIRWSYLDYDFLIYAREEDGDIILSGLMHGDRRYDMSEIINDDLGDLIILVGDNIWDDAKTVDNGLRRLIRNMEHMAHSRF